MSPYIVLAGLDRPDTTPLAAVKRRVREFGYDVQYLPGDENDPHIVDSTGRPIGRVKRHFTQSGREFACEIIAEGGAL